MRVWLYARLSNDDDREMNSLLNQREICQVFAEQHGYIIVGQSFDDNISGMSFDRRGLDELTAAVDADKIDAVIVKDGCVIIEPTQKGLENQGFVAGSICF